MDWMVFFSCSVGKQEIRLRGFGIGSVSWFLLFRADGVYSGTFASVGVKIIRTCLDIRFRWSDIIIFGASQVFRVLMVNTQKSSFRWFDIGSIFCLTNGVCRLVPAAGTK
jgi:hypothetical protein